MGFVVRAAMSVLLLLGVYVLAAGMVVGLTYVVYQSLDQGFGWAVLAKVGVIMALVVIALGRAFWATRRLGDRDPGGCAARAG